MNGLLVIDKPTAMTSHDVVSHLRRATGESTIGHLGTLDPMATGRFAPIDGEVHPPGAILWAVAQNLYRGYPLWVCHRHLRRGRNPGDPGGRPVAVKHQIQSAAARFRGQVEQTPPPFSAKKVEGKPAYKAARRGETVVLKSVSLLIEEFVIGEIKDGYAEFTIRISSGGYVRSVAHDLGKVLGCGAHLARLRRVAAGPFTLSQALTLEEVCAQAAAGTLDRCLPHPRTLLPELPATTADLWVAGRLRNGNAVNLPEFSTAPLAKVFAGQRDLVAIVRRVAGTLFQPIVVLG